MKTLIFLIFPCIMFSQIKELDTVGINNKAKVAVEEIVKNTVQEKNASVQVNEEIQKQIVLMKQIKKRVSEIKHSSKAVKINNVEEVKKQFTNIQGIKDKDFIIELDGQLIQWEQRPKKWLGRLFSKNDSILYPFIVDKDGNKIYLK